MAVFIIVIIIITINLLFFFFFLMAQQTAADGAVLHRHGPCFPTNPAGKGASGHGFAGDCGGMCVRTHTQPHT